MAKLSSDQKYVTVERGDTLSGIASTYAKYSNNATYKQLAAINNIKDPNKIAIGQKIYLVKTTSTTTKPATNSKAIIDHFGIQSNSDNLLFATWSWDKSYTDYYECQWGYATGDGVWFVGSKTTTTDKQSTYNMPSNATRVRFRVKPVSKKYTKNKKETSHWVAEWTNYKIHNVSEEPPDKPSAPNVEIDKYTLTAELDNINSTAKQIEFRVVRDDEKTYKTGVVDVKTKHAAFSCTVQAGHDYKVCCRGIKNKLYSEWSDYSGSVGTIPAAPKAIKAIKALSETSVYLDWDNVSNAESYDVEYTDQKRYFDSSNQTTTVSGIGKDTNGKVGHAEITGLESGKEWFFRVRSVNAKGYSAWTSIKSVVIGKNPGSPTTWSSTTTAIVGEPLNLYFVHNTMDNSNMASFKLELTTKGNTKTITIDATKDYNSNGISYVAPKQIEEGEVVTSRCSIDTTHNTIGSKIEWRVCTAGITNKYGDWSILRTVDIYEPPCFILALSKTSIDSFPFYINLDFNQNGQKPIGCHVDISSSEMYKTVDNVGETKIVKEGESVYSKYFDIPTEINDMSVSMTPYNINLESDITYKVTATVTMDSGLTATNSLTFTVAWEDPEWEPNAEISINNENTVSVDITPYCENAVIKYYEVTETIDSLGVNVIYVKTENEITSSIYGLEYEDAYTTSGEQVFQGTTDEGVELYYCEVREATLVENVLLSVYRKEFDGSFTQIATNIANYTTVVDLHPSLDYARYRIVATDKDTGGISYYDLPAFPIGETAIILQWDDHPSNFYTSIEGQRPDFPDWFDKILDIFGSLRDEMEQQVEVGSILRLPYNIDVSDSVKPDVELIEYIGRKHPVSYYGTHVGSTATWNVVIPRDDEETLYGLRRLATWMGDVYVREPSGSGYWANVVVSFSQKHNDLTIPVTLSITRVEGGM